MLDVPRVSAPVLLLSLCVACDAGQTSDLADSTDGSSMSDTTGSTGGAAPVAGSGAGGPAAAPVTPGEPCTPEPMTLYGDLEGPFGNAKMTLGGLEYFLQVNQWNGPTNGAQALDFGGGPSGGGGFYFRMTRQDLTVETNGAPTGYPSMFIGANSGNSTSGSNLPKQVSALTNVPTTWNWSDGGTLGDTNANSYNVAYDVWFGTSAAGDPDVSIPTGGYLMVWLYDPPDAQPVGSPSYPNITIPGVPGTWTAWVGTGARPIISYVASDPSVVTSLTFDLKNFINDAVAKGTIQQNWYLTNVFSGFEIWRGGVGLETTNFCVRVD